MAQVLEGLEQFALPYIDDIAIFSQGWKDHVNHIDIVLGRLRKAGLKVKPSKCKFAQEEVLFLGHRIGSGSRSPSDLKIKAIADFPRPTTKTQVRSFLGLVGYYSHYIPNYSTIASPLTDALKGKIKKEKITWNEKCGKAFEELKAKLVSQPILFAPDFATDFILQTDASEWTKSLPRQLTVALHTQWRIILKGGKTTTVGRRGSAVGHLLVCEETGKREREKEGKRARKRQGLVVLGSREENPRVLLGDADQESEARMSKNALRTGWRQAVEAVHLELTSSLSTDAFLLSLRRFIARRGRPRVIYSDNGTNFRGAHGELSGIDWEKVLKLATIQRIIWKFNPPTAAWWERLVRVLKELLRRTLGNAILTTEEFQTLLCDCESVINSRPLTYLSENSDDLVPLSPAMFIVENRNLDVPDIDYRDTANLRKRVRYRQKLLNDLRHRFRKEYLGLLIQNKKGPLSEVRLGEIVLIGDDIKKRMHWPLAKVIRLIPGKDGKIRTVELKTRTGTMLRPIQRVYPLEVQSTETLNDPLNDCTITNPISSISSDNLSDPNDSSNVLPRVSKYGRVIKVPEKLDLFNQVLYVFESK
ncbi:retrovirus-related Pol polyprotein from transposon 297 [Trichonephila clavipes]|nr:retrovirus-related Pol polyprotein from transposon 297 [Trichonephila clavipes]